MFLFNNKSIPAPIDSKYSFLVKTIFWDAGSSDDNLYRQIVFNLIRDPKKLIIHIQRISITYRLAMQDQMYAAIADLIFILNGKGHALADRMLEATKGHLTEQQYNELRNYLNDQNSPLLVGNKFCVCLTGKTSNKILVVEKKRSNETEYDVLQIAHDYIEYSQLDEALETLDKAFLKMPERKDIEIELIELLGLTNNDQIYSRITSDLEEKGHNLSDEWKKLGREFFGAKCE